MFLYDLAINQKNQEFLILSKDIAKSLGEYATSILEVIGILVIVLISIYTLIYGMYQLIRTADRATIFRETRHRLIRGILLGLDFLVAADIIRTVAVELTFGSIGVLAIIVLIRILLSFTLEVEMTGYWPWQQERNNS